MSKQYIAAAIVIGIVGIAFYAGMYDLFQQSESVPAARRMQVVASFYPLAHSAEQIGKAHADVLNLTPAGSEPHDFDPSPKDVAALQNANLFLYNGAGLESWASRIVPELEKKGVRIVEASKGLRFIGSDPHVWLDPVLVKEGLHAISSAFVDIDPAHAAAYVENAKAYGQELETLDADFKKGLESCKRRDIVTSHAAFAYLAQRYNLNMVPIAGLSPEEEPSPGRLAEIAEFVRSTGATHIFFETLVSPKISETIAKETGAQTLSLNPLEGLSDEEIAQGKTYISVQRENLHALRTALACI